MSKKITKEDFLSRFYAIYPEAKIELLDYSSISNSLTIRCDCCGKEQHKRRAREFLNGFSCCGSHPEITKIEKLKQIYKKNEDFDFIKQTDKGHFIVRHKVCGQDLIRVISNSLDNPFACKYCGARSKSQLASIQDVQKTLDELFRGSIQALDYGGAICRNHYKCLRCGLIFTQKHFCLLQSRGCPKCNRYKSKGKVFVAKLLEQNGVEFQEQAKVPELPLQSFDFCVYQNGEVAYYIEVQGEQHYDKVDIFRDSLDKIIERDKRKQKYCQEKGIPLYELVYLKGKIRNLDILPLDTTTISGRESTSQANGEGKDFYLEG